MTIREMRREDLASVKAIDRSAFSAEDQYDDGTYERLLRCGCSKVVLHENRVVGYAFVQGGRYARIRSLAVHEDYRRRGYATALLRAAVQEGECEVDLLVDEGNDPAIGLYESFGFTRAEMCPTVPPKRRMVLKRRQGERTPR